MEIVNDNRKYCKAIYLIKDYITNYGLLPCTEYVDTLTGIEVGSMCKELALDYYGDNKLYYGFSKKYKSIVRSIFKGRKVEVERIYGNKETENNAVKEIAATEENEIKEPANSAAEEKGNGDNMVKETYFVSINNIKAAFKLSKMSNKDFSEKYDLPASSVSKIVYGNYPGKRFKDSPLRFMEVKKETINKLKELIGDGIVTRHFTDSVVREKMTLNGEFRTLTIKQMKMFDVVKHGKLFRDDNVNVLSDVGLTALINSKDNKFLNQLLDITKKVNVSNYDTDDLRDLKRLRKLSKYDKSKVSYNLEDLDHYDELNEIFNYLASIDIDDVKNIDRCKVIEMYNTAISNGYSINKCKEIPVANKAPRKRDIFSNKVDEVNTIATEEVAEPIKIKEHAKNAEEKKGNGGDMVKEITKNESNITIMEIAAAIDIMSIEQLDVLTEYIEGVKASKIKIQDASNKLLRMF